MTRRTYFSIRTGKHPGAGPLDLQSFKRLFLAEYEQLEEAGYFQEHFGYWCVDAGDVPGALGNVDNALYRALRKDDLWPIRARIADYSEDDLFDIVEFLHDHVSAPKDGWYHSFNQCGHHYNAFHTEEGRVAYRSAIRPLLQEYQRGYALSGDGEILELPGAGLETLVDAPIPSDEAAVSVKVHDAVVRFRRHRSSVEDRAHALRDLVDVLEYLRPAARHVLDKKDERDLFDIANNFGIRHHRPDQKSSYDRGVFHAWLFYYYLSSIHACLHLIARRTPDDD